MKLRYRYCLSTLQNLKYVSKDRPHEDMAKLLIYSIKKPNAGTLQSRYYSNGYLREDEIFSIQKILKKEIFITENNQKSVNEDCINIPVKGNVNSSLGYGITVYDESQTATYSISSQLAKDLGININNSEMIFGTGNSMEPTIKGGDALLVDLSKKDVNDGKIYCIRHDGELKTKRLQKISKTKIKIISDNKDYDPVLIDFEKDISVDFEVIGEIRWCGRIFL